MTGRPDVESTEAQIIVDLTLSERVALATPTASHRSLGDGTVLVEVPIYRLPDATLPRLRSRSTFVSRLRMRLRRR